MPFPVWFTGAEYGREREGYDHSWYLYWSDIRAAPLPGRKSVAFGLPISQRRHLAEAVPTALLSSDWETGAHYTLLSGSSVMCVCVYAPATFAILIRWSLSPASVSLGRVD